MDEHPSVNDKVQAGMAFLDKNYPGHVERFNPDIFNIGSPRVCALAQAAGMPWWDAVEHLYGFPEDLTEAWIEQEDMGFLASNQDAGRRALNEAWLAAYAERKAALTSTNG